ncbi:hypothetical protein B0H19DRAFT_1100984 [Mycena capillaripes]|nr:hypothetical protein B0H19DRAFT_1100984 [Mycena capillaripes]
MPLGIKAAVCKLQKVIRAVLSSLQRRQQWYSILSPRSIVAGMHMLIFDVKTRWSSTQQMIVMITCQIFFPITDNYSRFCSSRGTGVFGYISLRRSSLKPDTFRTLILLKHHLHLKCKVLEEALQPTEEL